MLSSPKRSAGHRGKTTYQSTENKGNQEQQRLVVKHKKLRNPVCQARVSTQVYDQCFYYPQQSNRQEAGHKIKAGVYQ